MTGSPKAGTTVCMAAIHIRPIGSNGNMSSKYSFTEVVSQECSMSLCKSRYCWNDIKYVENNSTYFSKRWLII